MSCTNKKWKKELQEINKINFPFHPCMKTVQYPWEDKPNRKDSGIKLTAGGQKNLARLQQFLKKNEKLLEYISIFGYYGNHKNPATSSKELKKAAADLSLARAKFIKEELVKNNTHKGKIAIKGLGHADKGGPRCEIGKISKAVFERLIQDPHEPPIVDEPEPDDEDMLKDEDLRPCLGVCCCIGGFRFENPECLSCNEEVVCPCCTQSCFACNGQRISVEDEPPRMCCCENTTDCMFLQLQNTCFLHRPPNSCVWKSRFFCLEVRCALPSTADVPCLCTGIPYCVICYDYQGMPNCCACTCQKTLGDISRKMGPPETYKGVAHPGSVAPHQCEMKNKPRPNKVGKP